MTRPINLRFTFIPDTQETERNLSKIHLKFKELAEYLDEVLPDNSEKIHCWDRMEEAMHWAERSYGRKWNDYKEGD